MLPFFSGSTGFSTSSYNLHQLSKLVCCD